MKVGKRRLRFFSQNIEKNYVFNFILNISLEVTFLKFRGSEFHCRIILETNILPSTSQSFNLNINLHTWNSEDDTKIGHDRDLPKVFLVEEFPWLFAFVDSLVLLIQQPVSCPDQYVSTCHPIYGRVISRQRHKCTHTTNRLIITLSHMLAISRS